MLPPASVGSTPSPPREERAGERRPFQAYRVASSWGGARFRSEDGLWEAPLPCPLPTPSSWGEEILCLRGAVLSACLPDRRAASSRPGKRQWTECKCNG